MQIVTVSIPAGWSLMWKNLKPSETTGNITDEVSQNIHEIILGLNYIHIVLFFSSSE